MTHTNGTTLSNGERAEDWYERFQSEIETPENIGKLVSIDVENGNYAVGTITR